MNRTHSLDNDAAAKLATIAAASDAPPHLISLTTGARGRKQLTAYTATSVSDRKGRQGLLRHLRQSGIEADFQVIAQPAGKLARAASIEQLLGMYRGTDYVYDPTGGFTRSRVLLEFGHRARAILRDRLNGIFWHSDNQSLYLLLDRDRYFQDAKVKVADLGETESLVKAAMRHACGDTDSGFIKAIKLGFDLPAVALLPVDRASFRKPGFSLGALKGRRLASALAIALGTGAASTAVASGAEPAVSEPNGKIAVFGGQIDGDNNALDGDPFGLAGSYTFPMSHGTGMQLDGLVARLDGETVAGAGVHLFARDPSRGLIGVVGSYTSIGRDGANVPDQDVGLAGAEGELYLNEFTLAASLGHQFGDNVDDGAVGSLDLSWYANDNLMLGVGGATTPDVNKMAIASIEYQPAMEGLSGLTVFADAAFGDDDYSSVMVGLRYYFGGSKSLKDRHRRDDPINNLPLYSLQRGSSTGGY